MSTPPHPHQPQPSPHRPTTEGAQQQQRFERPAEVGFDWFGFCVCKFKFWKWIKFKNFDIKIFPQALHNPRHRRAAPPIVLR